MSLIRVVRESKHNADLFDIIGKRDQKIHPVSELEFITELVPQKVNKKK